MKITFIAVLLVVLCGSNAFALPQEQQSPNTNKGHQISQSHKNDSEIMLPLSTIKIESTSKTTNKKTTQNTNESKEPKKKFFDFTLTDLIVALFTVILAVVAVQQYKIFPRIEKAYVFVEVLLEEGVFYSPSGNAASNIKVIIRNHGKTPAILTKLRGYAPILEHIPNELINFPGSDATIPEGIVIASGGTYPLTVQAHISTLEGGQIEHGEKTLFCCGSVSYKDILGCHRETGYCWQYGTHNEQFVISPNTRLNYTK